MTNEIPTEEGTYWLVRHKEQNIDVIDSGECICGDDGLRFLGFYYMIHNKYFNNYDWHRIELPEGWR